MDSTDDTTALGVLRSQQQQLWDTLDDINTGFLDSQLDDNAMQIITATLILNGWHQ